MTHLDSQISLPCFAVVVTHSAARRKGVLTHVTCVFNKVFSARRICSFWLAGSCGDCLTQSPGQLFPDSPVLQLANSPRLASCHFQMSPKVFPLPSLIALRTRSAFLLACCSAASQPPLCKDSASRKPCAVLASDIDAKRAQACTTQLSRSP